MDTTTGIHASFLLYASFAGRNLKMMNVTAYSHFNASGESLENAFYFVVFIDSFSFDMEVHTGRVAQRFEKMEEHLGRHVANFFAGEGGIPYQPGPSAEIE